VYLYKLLFQAGIALLLGVYIGTRFPMHAKDSDPWVLWKAMAIIFGGNILIGVIGFLIFDEVFQWILPAT
jgi:hypothetical protein